MKLSFSLPPKPSSKAKKPSSTSTRFNDDDDRRDDTPKPEFLTEFDPSKTLTEAKQIVIPPKENEWRPIKKMKNLELPAQPDSDPNLRFQLESPSLADNNDPSNMSYGLNIRKSSKSADSAAESDGGGDERPRSTAVENLLLEKLREDLDRLPEDRGFEEFDDVPVEGFGAALLRGYGWEEGRGIGKNAKEDVKVKQYKMRGRQEGLGFFSDAQAPKMESVEKPRDNERSSNTRKEKEKENSRERDNGNGGNFDKRVSKQSREAREVSAAGNGTSRDRDGREQVKPSKVSWLTSHIRVRIISKELKRGRLYLKKGQVVDVIGPTLCNITMDDSQELIEGVKQDFLETALPRRGGPVLVLNGKHKGVYGTLVERDLDRDIAVVRDADNHGLINVRLDQIAEYIGDPSDMGY